MVRTIDHIGIAVHSIDTARHFYEQVLGLTCERIEELPEHQVRTAFFRLGELHLELLEPLGEDGPIARFLAQRGEGVHHIAYASDDLAGQMAQARQQGCRLLHEAPVPGAGGKRIAFLHPKSSHGVLTELCEPGPGDQ
ncbi:MAG: methylmalonyl-CoA epimerase [Desulfobulbaceae bacterium A2]|nr:MAG: methylmalonyl-CoA epimerase [Desulfobulbaceae bacterium A2]